MADIPRSLVAYFLLGRASPGELQRFTQDAGIVADVWLSFAEDLSQARRILLTPVDGMSAIETAATIHDALRRYRAQGDGASKSRSPDDPLLSRLPGSRTWTNVAPLESFVAVTLYFDELVRVILPLTHWWHDKNLRVIQTTDRQDFRDALENSISIRLGRSGPGTPSSSASSSVEPSKDPVSGRRLSEWKVLEATSIIAMIGVFAAVARDPGLVTDDVRNAAPNDGADGGALARWTSDNAREIARTAVRELRCPVDGSVDMALSALGTAPRRRTGGLIQRVFLDRESQLADADAICTVKADAADRVFHISCENLTWAIVDSGVAAEHPAFDEFERGPNGQQARTGKSRVRASYDLTLIDRIRNFDLTTADEVERSAVIEDIIFDLKRLPGTRAPDFERVAAENLKLIAAQLKRRLLPDWALIEPLIRVLEDDGTDLSSDHGTHVAGILAGDWREPSTAAGVRAPDDSLLRGICPDISLYDLRVLHPKSLKNTEFAVIAALEFVRYINSRAAGPPIIHGVNVSLSIPHEVRNYGCGVTPICVACDELVQSGVVVVAAAGNRGWDEREMGFGNFMFCSITDPGNAQQVITVGATHRLKPHSYGVSYFSSRGPTGDGRVKPDLVAPGEKIRGPIRGGADDELDGTSMAAPFVSGAAAMLMARNRELMRNPQKIKTILCQSATDLGRERYFQGHGLVDVLRALQSV